MAAACSIDPGALLSKTSPKFTDWNHQLGFSPSFRSNQFAISQFLGQPLVALNQKSISSPNSFQFSVTAQASYCVSRSMRWWEKTLIPNMIEIQSAQELVDTLRNAGDRLVIIDFYSPACGACRTLHPKMCQLAESNPGAIFLKVNQEELNKMCHALHIHVLPFFRFYKGSKGLLCSFSCAVSTIKKFKNALEKHSSELQQCNLVGQAKGLNESELVNLASVGEISMNVIQQAQLPSSIAKAEIENLFIKTIQNPTPLSILEAKEDEPMLVA